MTRFILLLPVFLSINGLALCQTTFYKQSFKNGIIPSQLYSATPNDTLVTGMGPIGSKDGDPSDSLYYLNRKRYVIIDTTARKGVASQNPNYLTLGSSKNISTIPAYFTRAFDFLPVPPSMLVLFDLRIAEVAKVPAPDALTFMMGSNFSNDGATPPNSDIYAKFSISPQEDIPGERRFKVSKDADTTRIFNHFTPSRPPDVFYKIAFVLNNRTDAIGYGDEFDHSGTVAPDTYDLWIGPEMVWVTTPSGDRVQSKVPGSVPILVFDNAPVQTASQSIKQFKFIYNPTTTDPSKGIKGEIELDNILMRDISGVLPVTYSYFRANATENKQVKLEWATSSETMSDYFMVQRSQDLQQVFKDVVYQKAAGMSKGNLNYSAIDESPLMGTTYYRLKQTDLNGNVEYSRPVAVTLSNESLNVRVYPNPNAGSEIFVQVPDAALSDIQLYNAGGFKMATSQTTLSQNLVKLNPIEHLSDGVYVVQVRTEGDLQIRKLVIK